MKEAIISFLSCYGEITSDVLQVVANNATSGGEIHLGSYRVQIKLTKDLPQLVPLMGKRVNLYYRGIQNLCPNCFGPQPKKVCHSQKVPWISYVSSLIAREKDIPVECYGKWMDILKKADGPAQKRNDAKVVTGHHSHSTTSGPRSQEAGNDALPNMVNAQVSQDSQVTAWVNNLPQTNEQEGEGKMVPY